MKIKEAHQGYRVRQLVWSNDQYYDILEVGKFTIMFRDEQDRDLVLPRDDYDDTWILLGRTEQFKFNPKKPHPPELFSDDNNQTYPLK